MTRYGEAPRIFADIIWCRELFALPDTSNYGNRALEISGLGFTEGERLEGQWKIAQWWIYLLRTDQFDGTAVAGGAHAPTRNAARTTTSREIVE